MTDLRDYPIDFLKCKVFRHEWEQHHPIGKKNKWGYPVYLLCVQCGAEREDIWDINGNLSHRNYIYPDGFQLGRVDMADCRKELLRRSRKGTRRS